MDSRDSCYDTGIGITSIGGTNTIQEEDISATRRRARWSVPNIRGWKSVLGKKKKDRENRRHSVHDGGVASAHCISRSSSDDDMSSIFGRSQLMMMRDSVNSSTAMMGEIDTVNHPFAANSNGLHTSSKADRRSSTRDLLQSNAISAHARESIKELTDLNFSEDYLQGRTQELRQLKAAYNRVSRGVSSVAGSNSNSSTSGGIGELVLISAPSGTGKTALARQLKLSNPGNCFQGKFDLHQQQQGENNGYQQQPYLALLDAFEDMCAEIYCNSRHSDQCSLRDDILQQLAVSPTQQQQLLDSEILHLIPSLRKLLRRRGTLSSKSINQRQSQDDGGASVLSTTTDASDTAITGKSQQNQVIYLLQSLARILSQYFQPLVIILDDLQWADEPSLQLISKLVTPSPAGADKPNGGLLMIGTYRHDSTNNNQQIESEFLVPWLIEMRLQIPDRLEEIVIGNLPVDGVNEIIQRVLKSSDHDAEDTRELATVVHRKTNGNPFFVIQFVTTLRDLGILDYQIGHMKWEWDQAKVETLFVTNNVLHELLTVKLKHLPEFCQFLCQIAACFGASFHKDLLHFGAQAIVQQKLYLPHQEETKEEPMEEVTVAVVHNAIARLLADGIFEQNVSQMQDTGGLLFSHDQIQSTAASMIPKEAQREWKAVMGHAMLESSYADEYQWIFMVANLCNHGVSGNAIIDTPLEESRAKLIELNAKAGVKAINTAAYSVATNYFETAIGLLNSDCWNGDTALPLNLYSMAGEAAYCNGDFHKMQTHLDHVLNRQDIPFDTKLRPYATMIVSFTAKGQYQECIDTGLGVLKRLGIKFPANPSPPRVVMELVKTKLLVSSLSFEELCNLPLLDDEKQVYIARIFDILATATYKTRSGYFPLLSLRHVQRCIRNGVGTHSPVAFGTFAIILCGKLGDLQDGYRKAKIAMAILDRLPNRACASRMFFIFNAFASHWVSPAHKHIRVFREGYQVGLQLGDIESAMFNLMSIVHFSWACGKQLATVEEEARRACIIMEESQQTAIRSFVAAFWQQTLNFMGRAIDPLHLVGEAMAQGQVLQMAEEIGNVHLVSVIHSLQMHLAYFLGTAQSMEDLLNKSSDLLNSGAGTIHTQRHVFFEGMVAFFLAGNYDGRRRRKWMQHGTKIKKRVAGWVKGGAVNCIHCLSLLEAELLVLHHRRDKAKFCYEKAISMSSKNGYQQDRSLAHERAGINFLALDDSYWASHHLSCALEGYLQWGAIAKVRHMENQYKDLVDLRRNED